MPRLPRCRRAPGSLEPGQLYHVTNRGVDRCQIFHSDLDRVLFLSMLAEACLHTGARCHAVCLMTTHFHFVVEDQRGLLSQLLHRIESSYARYFNDTRQHRRRGPLFESRFCAELIDSTEYFEEACAYVVLNPVRTQVPLAACAERYRWSSAALVCSDLSPSAFAEGLLGPFGGVAGVLAALPPSSRTSSRELRAARLEALASGAWMEREQVLAGRTPEHYRRMLAARAPSESIIAPAADVVARARPLSHVPAAPAVEVIHARRFCGFALEDVRETIRDACARVVPASLALSPSRLAEVFGYALYRFSAASLDELASVINVSVQRVGDALRRVRRDRTGSPAWQRLLWTLEWRLRWRLNAAPHRG